MAVNGVNGANGVTIMEPPKTPSNTKKTDYLEWDEYFMALAFLAAKRSKDPCTQVGACIVDDEARIVGLGYNGMPRGCNDDEFPWGKDPDSQYDSKFLYVCHAEVNAVLNKNMQNLNGCTMYVGLFPCNECAKVIIQSGIKTIVYMSDKHAHKIRTKASKRMLDAAGVKYRQYIPLNDRIEINFQDINWNNQNQLPVTPSSPSVSPTPTTPMKPSALLSAPSAQLNSTVRRLNGVNDEKKD